MERLCASLDISFALPFPLDRSGFERGSFSPQRDAKPFSAALRDSPRFLSVSARLCGFGLSRGDMTIDLNSVLTGGGEEGSRLVKGPITALKALESGEGAVDGLTDEELSAFSPGSTVKLAVSAASLASGWMLLDSLDSSLETVSLLTSGAPKADFLAGDAAFL